VSHTLSIKNFRKIKSANISVGGITLIAGQNGQGKTSIAQALSSLLTGDLYVLAANKNQAHMMVHTGSPTASAILHGDDGSEVSMEWPSMSSSSKGVPPKASDMATGKVRFSRLSPKEASDYLIKLLNATPSKKEVFDLISPILGEDAANAVWDIIESRGWDDAEKVLRDQVRDRKSDWKAVTGAGEWGVQKGASYSPPNLPAHGISEDILIQQIADAKRLVDGMIGKLAVDMSRTDELKKSAEPYDSLVKQRALVKEKIEDRRKKIADLKEEIHKLPFLNADSGFPCPHCSGTIVKKIINSGVAQYVKAESVPQKELDDARAANAKLCGDVSFAESEISQFTKELSKIEVEGKIASAARKELATIEASQGGTVSAEDIQKERDRIDLLESYLSGLKKKVEADNIHKRITMGIEVCEIVGPEGLRKAAAQKHMVRLNDDIIAPLCDKFGIERVTVGMDMSVSLGQYPYKMLSESAKFRVDTVLQVAFATQDGSHMVIVDGADIIVGKDRGGIIKMLNGTIPALITMSMVKPDTCPSLASIGGNVYWVENGNVNIIEG